MSQQLDTPRALLWLRAWFDKISGEQFSTEQRVFNCALVLAIIIFCMAIFYAFVVSLWSLSIVLLFCAATYYYCYLLSSKQDNLARAFTVFALCTTVLLDLVWLLDHGALGSTTYFMFVFILLIMFVSAKPIMLGGLFLINLALLKMIEAPMQNLIGWQLPQSSLVQTIVLCLACAYMATLALFYRRLIRENLNRNNQQTVAKLRAESYQMDHAADGLIQAGNILSSSAMQQKSAIEQLLATTEELAATAEQNNQLAVESITALKRAELQLVESKSNTDQLLVFVKHIQQSGEEIQNINNVINDIAWQTNLLSLNAMIEASRAGEGQGGFRVVALEVKRLAEGAAEAADKINDLLAQNAKSIQQGVNASEQMHKAFDMLIGEIKPLSSSVRNMSEASIEQTQAILQINQGLTDIDKTVTQNQQAAEETAKTSAGIRENAKALMQVVDSLKEAEFSSY